MSLFSAIQSSISGLNAATVGLHVVSGNLANANTPGYSALRMQQATGPSYQRGSITLGTGVTIQGISQSGNRLLEAQLRSAIADADSTQVQHQIYQRLETMIGEMGGNDISTYLSRFYSALNEVANQPQSLSIRSLAIQQGQALVDKLNLTHNSALKLQGEIQKETAATADRVNQLLDEVAALNQRIVTATGSSGGQSAAHSMVDTRRTALRELGSLLDIRVVEFESGAVNIMTQSGANLMFDNHVSHIRALHHVDLDGFPRTSLVFQEGEHQLKVTSGRLAGLQVAGDVVVDEFLSQLEQFGAAMIGEFNRLHASGQGLSGLTQVTAGRGVADPSRPLDQAGLPFPPVNGSLRVHVRDTITGQIETTDLRISLGSPAGTTMNDLVAQLQAVPRLEAQLDHHGKLQIGTADSHAQFYFSDDTSGVLAALGINTFFTGTRPGNLGISAELLADPGRLAASRGGIGSDTENLLHLIRLESQVLPELKGGSLRANYELLVGQVAYRTSMAGDLAAAFGAYATTLEAEWLSQMSVNLDEEAVRMMQFQRAYQASARVIQTANDLFDTMLRL